MHLDMKTQLFVDISPAERRAMQSFCEGVVIEGWVPDPLPWWVEDWLDTFQPNNPHQKLLLLATVVPQRIMLSILQSDPYVRIGALGGALNEAIRTIRETDPKRADELVEIVRVNT